LNFKTNHRFVGRRPIIKPFRKIDHIPRKNLFFGHFKILQVKCQKPFNFLQNINKFARQTTGRPAEVPIIKRSPGMGYILAQPSTGEQKNGHALYQGFARMVSGMV